MSLSFDLFLPLGLQLSSLSLGSYNGFWASYALCFLPSLSPSVALLPTTGNATPIPMVSRPMSSEWPWARLVLLPKQLWVLDLSALFPTSFSPYSLPSPIFHLESSGTSSSYPVSHFPVSPSHYLLSDLLKRLIWPSLWTSENNSVVGSPKLVEYSPNSLSQCSLPLQSSFLLPCVLELCP